MSDLIIQKEDYQIFDKLASDANKSPQKRGPIGWVEVLLNHKKVFEGNNLVVAQGREFVAQKLFSAIEIEDGARADWRNYSISHFGIGSGGATASGDSYTLLGPFICDQYLSCLLYTSPSPRDPE